MKRSQSMPSVWKLHADRAGCLDGYGKQRKRKTQEAWRQAAQQGGFAAFAATVHEIVKKLRVRLDIAVGALAQLTGRSIYSNSKAPVTISNQNPTSGKGSEEMGTPIVCFSELRLFSASQLLPCR